MNQVSERLSHGPLTALSCHCSRRWVGHRTGLLGGQRGRHREDLGANVARPDLAVSHRAPGIPERCRLGFGHVAHDEPI
jgi:hypothetical protein